MKDTLRTEAKAVLSATATTVMALWVKRTVERLAKGGWCNPSMILGHGPPPQHTPSTPDLTHRLGAGNVSVPGWGRLYYRAALRTSDGHLLYDHETQLHPCHIGPCPLLRADTDCEACVWYLNDGPYHYEPKCAALVKLEDAPHGVTMGLSDIKRALEHSI